MPVSVERCGHVLIRLGFFAGAFVVVALWELLAPRDLISLASACGLSRIVGAVADY